MPIHRGPWGDDTYWRWAEAFDKGGFDDGDGVVMTHVVAAAIQSLGYSVRHRVWGMHNDAIYEIKRADGNVVYPPPDNPAYADGYDDARTVLPPDIVAHLDAQFPD